MNFAKRSKCFPFFFKDCTEDKMDYKGLDLRYHNTDSAKKCQDKCNSDFSCRFWTWVKKIENLNDTNCFLKDSITNRIPNELTVSGIRNRNGKRAENITIYIAKI
jgi:hypothetical protein